MNKLFLRKKLLETNCKINVTTAINVLHAIKEKIYSAYISKHNSKSGKQFIIFMISNGQKWHYLADKKLSALLKGIFIKK